MLNGIDIIECFLMVVGWSLLLCRSVSHVVL